MSKNRKVISASFTLVVIAWLFIQGCAKDSTVIIEPKPVAITRTVGFAKDILPVFIASCNTSGCHNTGGHKPDLTKNNAYASLKDGNYINKAKPENSEVYLWLTGKRATAMPMGAPKNPKSINELILAWIKQGAKNN